MNKHDMKEIYNVWKYKEMMKKLLTDKKKHDNIKTVKER